MRLRALLTVAAMAMSLTGCQTDDLPPGTQYSSIQGTVTDAATHQPIADATVVVDTVLTTTTDANGNFSIAKVPSGIVDYVVHAKGYADLAASSNAEPGKPFTLNVAMRPPQP